MRQSVPRILYRVCQFIETENCFLTEQQATSSFFMTLNPGVLSNEENLVRSRTAII
jgi:hypothetical protein